MADEISDAIKNGAAGPKAASQDGRSMQARDLGELIEADQYLAKKCANTTPSAGMRIGVISNKSGCY
jgi:hypothetical protein